MLITLPKPTYAITCPPTFIPDDKWNHITLCGESAGSSEVNWWQCPLCHSGQQYPGICSSCKLPRKFSPQGFVGASGNMLRMICKNGGIDFSLCNRTNVAKKQPPGKDFSNFYHDPKKRTSPTEELLWWRELLIAELSRYKPNIVVALGNEALRALTSEDGITKWQGSILTSNVIPNLKVIPVVHPAYIMRDNWEEYYTTIKFFKRIAIESKSPTIQLKEPNDIFIITPNLSEVLEFISFIGESKEPWYLDIETRGDTLTCFGLASDSRKNYALCVPIQDTTGPHWSAFEEAQIWKALSLAASVNPRFCNQNMVYDLDYLLDMGVEPSGLAADPMIMANVAFPELPKGLDFTTSIYTYYPYYKDEGKTWKKSVPDLRVREYNCKDMVATPKVTIALTKELKEKNLYEVYRKLSHQFLNVALEMQRNRLRLNRDWHTKLAGYLADERILKHQELTSLIGREINVKSSPEVQKLLYQELRLPEKKKRGSDSLTTEEKKLKELRAEHPEIPHLKLILEERHLRTKESNYINAKFDIDQDGSLYLPFMPLIGGTKTSRWTFKKSPKWRGSSAQTISKVMRLMYEPPIGSVFWQRDLSQAEARHVAYKSDCRFLTEVFSSPIKIHKLVGGKIWKCDPLSILSDTPRYDVAKRIVHGRDYMLGYKSAAIQANVDYDFMRVAYGIYEKETPEIDDWHKWVATTVKTTGRLTTPLGRVRECYKACSAITHTGQLPDEILRDLISWEPQAVVPDLTNAAMFSLWESYPDVRWHQQNHDSYLASGDPQRTEEFAEASRTAGNIHYQLRDINGRDKDCFIPGEFSWGYLWGAMLSYTPGEDTSREAWEERATNEGYFDEGKIKEKLYSLF